MGEVSDVRSNMAATLRLTKTDYVNAFPIVDARRLLKMGGYAKIHPQLPEG